MTAFDQVTVLPGAELYVAVELSPNDSNGIPVVFRVTSAPFLFTEPTDTPQSTLYRSLINGDWKVSRRLSARGTFLDSSEYSLGDFSLDNSRGTFDGHKSLSWNDSPVVVRMGARVRSDGTPFPFADYATAFSGRIEAADPSGNLSVNVTVAGRSQVFSEPAVRTIYRAFGGSIHAPDGSIVSNFTASDPSLDHAFPVSWELVGRVRTLPGVRCGLFRRNLNAGIQLGADGELLVLSGGSSTGTGHHLVPGVFYVGLAFESPTSARVFAGVDGDDVDLVWEGTVPAAVNAGTFKFNRIGATDHGDLELWEFRHRAGVIDPTTGQSHALVLDDVLYTVDGPVGVTVEGLLEVVRFGDLVGTQAKGLNSLLTLDLAGGAVFDDSLTGDDPVQFGGALLGQSEQDAVGEVFNAPLVAVSTPLHHYRWGKASSPGSDHKRVKLRGSPLVYQESITSTGLGEISILSDVLDFSTPLSGHRFVPGQADPPRQGQRVEISNAGAPWDGLWLVDVAGVTGGGRFVALLAEDGTPAGLPDADLPSGTTVATPDDDWQWKGDLTRQLITTRFALDGEPTIDLVARLPTGGVCTYSTALEMVLQEALGASLETSLLDFDPGVGWVVPKGNSPELWELVRSLSRSAWAWLIEDRAGGYKTGTWKLPVGDPVATIATSPRNLIPGASAPLTGRVVSFEEVPTEDPSWRFLVGHSRNWTKHEPGELVGSVSPADRERLTSEWLHSTPWTDPRNRKNFRKVSAPEVFETYITNAEDAQQLQTIAVPFLGTKRRIYEAEVAGLPFLGLDLDDVVLVEHPDPTYDLVGGRLCRVLSIEEDAATDSTTLEVYQ